MPKIRWILFLMACIGLVSESEAALAPVRLAQAVSVERSVCACAAAPNDPNDPALQFNFGYYKGQCVDTCFFRAAKISYENPHHIRVANVLHLDKFYLADLPIDSLTEVDVGFEEFLKGISHVFLRFHFSQPVRFASSDVVTHDVIISAEGVPPKGHRYDFFESSLGHYLLAYRILSVEEARARMVKRLHHSVRQFKLNLGFDQQRRLLLFGLRQSESRSFHTIYDLFTNNCATSAVDLLSQQLSSRPASDSWNWFERGLPIDGFYGTFPFLIQWGLISSPQLSRIANLEDETAT